MKVQALNMSRRRSVPERRILSAAILSVGFSLTGSGTVMLGVVLPALSKQWAFRDDQLGALLFLLFFGSGLGAVFAGLNRIRSLKFGYGFICAGLCALIFTGSRLTYPAVLIYGLGLGMAMTATSQLFSDRWGNDRAAKLEWLNFVWSLGAAAGPICFVPFLSKWTFQSVFQLMLSLFLCIFFWVVVAERDELNTATLRAVRQSSPEARIVFYAFLMLAMGFVGVEASLSGWLSTYSGRAGIQSVAGTSLATSIFWFGEMASRLIFSTRLLAKLGRATVLGWGIYGVTAAALCLTAFPHPVSILIAAGASGFFIGPLYPLALSHLMELSPWGWFFAAGGMGAAVFPWTTGLVSSHFHSLRCGLMVPCAAGLVMIAINMLASRSSRAIALAVPVHDGSIQWK